MHHHYWTLLLLLFALPHNALCQERDRLQKLPLERLLALGYQAAQQNQVEAVPYFEEAARREPGNGTIQEQLGYLFLALGRQEEALDRFRIADSLHPSDSTKLQEAYLLQSLGRSGEAISVFRSLEASPSVGPQAAAEAAGLPQEECRKRFPWWWNLYADPYFEGRFNDLILDGAVRGGRYIVSDRRISLFGVLSLTRDTRSIGGALPVIYSDNFVLLGAGVRFEPMQGVIADLQGGVAQDLIDRPDHAGTEGDFRAVASYGAGWYPRLEIPDGVATPFSTFGDVYASYGYYSRYANTIGYLQVRTGVRALEFRHSAADVYLRGDLAVDTKREYYNNIAEVSLGIRFIPDHRWNLNILAELHRGTYWGSSSIPNPYAAPYTSFRLFLILDRCLSW